jgi:hypothetical protein
MKRVAPRKTPHSAGEVVPAAVFKAEALAVIGV